MAEANQHLERWWTAALLALYAYVSSDGTVRPFTEPMLMTRLGHSFEPAARNSGSNSTTGKGNGNKQTKTNRQTTNKQQNDKNNRSNKQTNKQTANQNL
jgi:hypothetical protein